VLIGACIPCLHPLVRKIFGAKALDTPSDEQREAIVTFGSHPKDRQRRMTPLGVSGPDTIACMDEMVGVKPCWTGTTLGDSQLTASTAEEWAAEAIEKLQQEQQRIERMSTPPDGWM
jgi:hypothetical protein